MKRSARSLAESAGPSTRGPQAEAFARLGPAPGQSRCLRGSVRYQHSRGAGDAAERDPQRPRRADETPAHSVVGAGGREAKGDITWPGLLIMGGPPADRRGTVVALGHKFFGTHDRVMSWPWTASWLRKGRIKASRSSWKGGQRGSHWPRTRATILWCKIRLGRNAARLVQSGSVQSHQPDFHHHLPRRKDFHCGRAAGLVSRRIVATNCPDSFDPLCR